MRAAGGARLRALAAPALLLAGLVAGLFLAFPDAALRERVEHELARLPVAVDIERLSLHPPLSLDAAGVTLRPQPGLPEISLERVSVRPLWLSLLGDNPGLVFSAEDGDGSLEGTLRRDGDVSARANGLRIGVPVRTLEGMRLAGVLRGTSISGTFPPTSKSASSLVLRFENATLAGLDALGMQTQEVFLGIVTLRGVGEGASFKVVEFSANDGALLLSGSGTVKLASPLTASRINIALTMTPGRRLPDELAEILPLAGKPGQDGSYRLRLTGPLNAPAIR